MGLWSGPVAPVVSFEAFRRVRVGSRFPGSFEPVARSPIGDESKCGMGATASVGHGDHLRGLDVQELDGVRFKWPMRLHPSSSSAGFGAATSSMTECALRAVLGCCDIKGRRRYSRNCHVHNAASGRSHTARRWEC